MFRQISSYERRPNQGRCGFTLTELLVVIAIIGILAGLAIPAVMQVQRTISKGAAKMEVQNLADAVEKYRSKYDDYPPDGGSWPRMEAHIRKAFPNILQTELNLLNPAYRTVQVPGFPPTHALAAGNHIISNDYLPGRVMDPAEALVFFLGGFSSDSQKPFTGKGGPFVLTATGISFNGARDNALYEFDFNRLVGSDEQARFPNLPATDVRRRDDCLPVFLSRTSGAPFVYFDGKSYVISLGSAVIVNYHIPTADPFDPVMGTISPLLGPNAANNRAAGESPNDRFLDPKKFQVIGPGLDGKYGGAGLSGGVQPTGIFSAKGKFHTFVPSPSGVNSWFPLSATAPPEAFRLPEHGVELPYLDNLCSSLNAITYSDNLYQ